MTWCMAIIGRFNSGRECVVRCSGCPIDVCNRHYCQPCVRVMTNVAFTVIIMSSSIVINGTAGRTTDADASQVLPLRFFVSCLELPYTSTHYEAVPRNSPRVQLTFLSRPIISMPKQLIGQPRFRGLRSLV